MAYTLKTSGAIPTAAVMVVAMDSDNTTPKEFVSSDVNTNKAVDPAVTFSTATWKGATRGYFQTLDNSFNYKGITFPSGHRPQVTTQAAAISVFIAVAGMPATGSGSLGPIIEWFSSGSWLVNRSSSAGPLVNAIVPATANTSMPTNNTTPFSCGFSYDDVTNGTAFYYGLESGSMATDGTNNSHGFGVPTTSIWGIGGANGQGSQPAKYHIVAIFNRVLTLTEFQTLHNDFVGTLFDGASNAAPTFSGTISNISATQSVAISSVDVHALFSDPGDTLTYSASPGGTAWPSGLAINSSTGVITGTMGTVATTTGCKVRATDTAAQTVDSNAFNVTVAAPTHNVTITLTTDGTTPAANLSGLKWAWFDQITPDLMAAPTDKGSGASTDGSGVMTIALSATAKSAGGVGWLVVTNSDGTPTQSPAAKAFSGPCTIST